MTPSRKTVLLGTILTFIGLFSQFIVFFLQPLTWATSLIPFISQIISGFGVSLLLPLTLPTFWQFTLGFGIVPYLQFFFFELLFKLVTPPPTFIIMIVFLVFGLIRTCRF